MLAADARASYDIDARRDDGRAHGDITSRAEGPRRERTAANTLKMPMSISLGTTIRHYAKIIAISLMSGDGAHWSAE